MSDYGFNTRRTFSSEDVDNEIEKKSAELTQLIEKLNEKDADDFSGILEVVDELVDWRKNESETLEDLQKFKDAVNSAEWKYGITFINEYHWENFVHDLVEETTDLNRLPSYITDNINWDGVAEDIAVDYTTVTFDGEEFYFRE